MSYVQRCTVILSSKVDGGCQSIFCDATHQNVERDTAPTRLTSPAGVSSIDFKQVICTLLLCSSNKQTVKQNRRV